VYAVIARALAVGIVVAPFISALLLGLGWAGRALRHLCLRLRRPSITKITSHNVPQKTPNRAAVSSHDSPVSTCSVNAYPPPATAAQLNDSPSDFFLSAMSSDYPEGTP
jgi:hypothetical protein